MFVQGQLYKRRQLHDQFGGNRRGGISPSAQSKIIMIFTGPTGEQYGYCDGWDENGIFIYSGEGQVGDMKFTIGNKAIKEHMDNGKDIHLFEKAEDSNVRYIGQMVYTGFKWETGHDKNGAQRKVIRFELAPIDLFSEESSTIIDDSVDLTLPLSSLRERAIRTSTTSATPTERRVMVYQRSQAIKAYALKRADGHCEGCHADAPFRNTMNRPYLEVHHIRRLSDEGPDDPEWVIAVCPNCHRRAHYSNDKDTYNNTLKQKVDIIENTGRL